MLLLLWWLLLLLQQLALADVSFRSHPEDEQTEGGLVAETPHRPQQGSRNSNDAIMDAAKDLIGPTGTRILEDGRVDGRTGDSAEESMTSWYPKKIVFR